MSCLLIEELLFQKYENKIYISAKLMIPYIVSNLTILFNLIIGKYTKIKNKKIIFIYKKIFCRKKYKFNKRPAFLLSASFDCFQTACFSYFFKKS